MANERKQLREKKCPECGRVFIYRDYWTYKKTYGDHITAFCSWTCMRKREAKEQAKKKGRKDHE